eukprot:CAMPEP_0114516516 /NCGR_PEP_ID=MMETSP0109-20121206/17371_1 /TAXON_ID=29199 /ORGANISM="Chlorarachnion reptans, Strain CCCM449" /LENGTH=699 /DNA_ID=CAMNT_0001696913 /DNA_START=114 /DNA_END=2213 /DNA_ORIENTATION=+
MRVAIRTLKKAQKFAIDLDDGADVARLKDLVAAELGLASGDDVKLVWKGKLLRNGKVGELGLPAPGDTRFVVAYPKPSTRKKSPVKPLSAKRTRAVISSTEIKNSSNSKQRSVKIAKEEEFDKPRDHQPNTTTNIQTTESKEAKELSRLMEMIVLELRGTPDSGGNGNDRSISIRVLRPISKMFESAATRYLKDPRVHEWIAKGLRSRDAAISGGVSRLLTTCLKNNGKQAATLLFSSREVLRAIIAAICDYDIEVSAPAGLLLSEISSWCNGTLKLFCDDKYVYDAIKEETFSEVRFRILELGAKMAMIAVDGPDDYLASDIFKTVVKIAKRGPSNTDPLAWPNSLEIIGEAMRTAEGFDIVMSSKRLFDVILFDFNGRGEPLSVKNKLTVVHHLALASRRSAQYDWLSELDFVASSSSTSESRIVSAVLQACEDGMKSFDDTTKAMAAHGICLLTTCLKDFLFHKQHELQSGEDEKLSMRTSQKKSPSFQRLHKELTAVADIAAENISGPARVASLVGLAHVFGNEMERPSDKSTESRESKDFGLSDEKNRTISEGLTNDPLEEVWKGLSRRVGMSVISRSIQSPFEDVAGSAYTYLRNAASHLWGLEQIALTPGFIETLLDRHNGAGTSPQASEWRFATLQALAATLKRNARNKEILERLVDKPTQERLLEFVSRGPYWSARAAPQVKVATASRTQ